jgi:hypothetical protein
MAIKIGNVIQAKTGTAARTDTAAKTLFTLPSQAMVTGILGFGTASNATTTAIVTFTATELGTGTATTLGTVDVKAAGVATSGSLASLAGIAMLKQATAYAISATYSETSASASSAGGPYTFVLSYL